MIEREKMTLGMIYNPNCKELMNDRIMAHKLCTKYNKTYDYQVKRINRICRRLFFG